MDSAAQLVPGDLWGGEEASVQVEPPPEVSGPGPWWAGQPSEMSLPIGVSMNGMGPGGGPGGGTWGVSENPRLGCPGCSSWGDPGRG